MGNCGMKLMAVLPAFCQFIDVTVAALDVDQLKRPFCLMQSKAEG
jgi:hypothetical protein